MEEAGEPATLIAPRGGYLAAAICVKRTPAERAICGITQHLSEWQKNNPAGAKAASITAVGTGAAAGGLATYGLANKNLGGGRAAAGAAGAEAGKNPGLWSALAVRLRVRKAPI